MKPGSRGCASAISRRATFFERALDARPGAEAHCNLGVALVAGIHRGMQRPSSACDDLSTRVVTTRESGGVRGRPQYARDAVLETWALDRRTRRRTRQKVCSDERRLSRRRVRPARARGGAGPTAERARPAARASRCTRDFAGVAALRSALQGDRCRRRVLILSGVGGNALRKAACSSWGSRERRRACSPRVRRAIERAGARHHRSEPRSSGFRGSSPGKKSWTCARKCAPRAAREPGNRATGARGHASRALPAPARGVPAARGLPRARSPARRRVEGAPASRRCAASHRNRVERRAQEHRARAPQHSARAVRAAGALRRRFVSFSTTRREARRASSRRSRRAHTRVSDALAIRRNGGGDHSLTAWCPSLHRSTFSARRHADFG